MLGGTWREGGKVCPKIFKSSKVLCVVMNLRLFLVGFHSLSQWISLSVCPKVFNTQQIPVYKRIEESGVVQEYKKHGWRYFQLFHQGSHHALGDLSTQTAFQSYYLVVHLTRLTEQIHFYLNQYSYLHMLHNEFHKCFTHLTVTWSIFLHFRSIFNLFMQIQ